MSEVDEKISRIKALLAEHNLDAMLLRGVSSFAWATCGAASYVNTAASNGSAQLLITPTGRYVLADNIETPRLRQEEKLEAQGWDFSTHPWFGSSEAPVKLTRGLKLGTDGCAEGMTDLSGEIALLRSRLLPEEGERFRELGKLCAEAMQAAIEGVKPKQTEYEIAALMASEAYSRGVQPIVNLVATDRRVSDFRHPLPTSKTLDKYAMLVMCGRRQGLVCSITRLVHFGKLSDDLKKKEQAVASVDAAFLSATVPGRPLGEIFDMVVEAYAQAGYPDEWQKHHQGGSAGYEPRESIATPLSEDMVYPGQAYAWNPSITGTKSEDTILVGDSTIEVLTEIDGWPTTTIEIDGKEFKRPAILTK